MQGSNKLDRAPHSSTIFLSDAPSAAAATDTTAMVIVVVVKAVLMTFCVAVLWRMLY
jgi:hypothetical protein